VIERTNSTSRTSRSSQKKKGEEDLSPLHMHGLTRFCPREGERGVDLGQGECRRGARWWCAPSHSFGSAGSGEGVRRTEIGERW
jgi:hypothetical protein